MKKKIFGRIKPLKHYWKVVSTDCALGSSWGNGAQALAGTTPRFDYLLSRIKARHYQLD